MSWEDATALAQTASPVPVQRRSAGLPYMFQSATSICILVHRGRIVTERGLQVAAGYLRDLGVVDGQGPAIRDIVHALTVLDGLPRIEGFEGNEYILQPDSARLADLTARIEHGGGEARIVLHYFNGRTKTMSPSQNTGILIKLRRITRATLTIPRAGEAAWAIVDIEWADPEE